MKGSSTISTSIIVASIIAVAALVTLAVLRMGWAAGGGVAGSVSLAEQGGVMTATIRVLRGSLTGVAVRYDMQDGTAWWAKPLYCLSVNNTARLTPTAAYFSKPISAGQTVSCAFYVWAPSNKMYDLWVIGYGPSSTATFAQAHLLLSANGYAGNLPAGAATSGSNAVSVPPQQSVANYTLVPVNRRGGNFGSPSGVGL